MKILQPMRPDITGHLVEEFSTAAAAINLGNTLASKGHTVDYIGNIERARLHPTSGQYLMSPHEHDVIQMATALLTYREYNYDVLHLHTMNFASFNQLAKFMALNDRVILTIHVPSNIGRSFYYHQEDLLHLLRTYPNFRLVCVSNSGSYRPLKDFFGQNLPPGFDKVRMIYNGVFDPALYRLKILPVEERVRRIMFVAHMISNKNVLHTLEMAIENGIHCMYVGRRFPYKNGKIPPAVEEYASKCETLIQAHPGLIEHHEHLPHRQCMMEMGRSQALVVLSELESFGYTPVEAASLGTPVIWLECQGLQDTMVDGVTGFEIRRKEYKNWKARKRRAAELFHGVNTLDKTAMHDHVRDRFYISSVADRYVELYQEVCNGSMAN